MPSSDGRLVLRRDDPLLAGAVSDRERRARRRLLRELVAAGVPRDELQRAVDEDRLALLPAEVVLTGRRRFSDEALVRQGGVDRRVFSGWQRASGLPGDDRLTSRDLAAARALRALIDSGVPEREAFDVARIAGQGMAATARTMVQVARELYLRPGDSEYELGARYARVAQDLVPHLVPLLEHQLRLHLREALRQETIGRDERDSGRVHASREVAVAFADLVGFTRMGSHVEAGEVGRVAGRLVELAASVATGPVTLVKALGDGVMLVSTDTTALVDAVLRLVAAVGAEGPDLPPVRAGVAVGPAVPAGGDWYGHAVNLAARVTGLARPGTVLATTEVRRQAVDGFRWSRALPRRVRGVPGPVFLTRVRPAS